MPFRNATGQCEFGAFPEFRQSGNILRLRIGNHLTRNVSWVAMGLLSDGNTYNLGERMVSDSIMGLDLVPREG